jgi:hypothetical protein
MCNVNLTTVVYIPSLTAWAWERALSVENADCWPHLYHEDVCQRGHQLIYFFCFLQFMHGSSEGLTASTLKYRKQYAFLMPVMCLGIQGATTRACGSEVVILTGQLDVVMMPPSFTSVSNKPVGGPKCNPYHTKYNINNGAISWFAKSVNHPSSHLHTLEHILPLPGMMQNWEPARVKDGYWCSGLKYNRWWSLASPPILASSNPGVLRI